MSDAYNWDVVSGAKTTISPMIFDKMTDNSDGTYSYSYSVSNNGALSILVKLVTGNGVYSIFYSTTDWTGSPQLTTTLPFINFNQDANLNYPNLPVNNTDYSTYFYATIYTPVKDSYTFYVSRDDHAFVAIDGVTKTIKINEFR